MIDAPKSAVPVPGQTGSASVFNISDRGPLNAKGVGTLEAEAVEKAKNEAIAASLAKPPAPKLAQYIDNCFNLAKDAKRDVELKLLQSQRQRDGEYDPEKKQALKAIGDPIIFIRLTDTKCGSFESWVNDILGIGKKALVEPTPVPDLPPNIIEQIVEKTMEQMQKDAETLGESAMSPENAYNLAKIMRDSMEKQLATFAKQTAALMSQEIEDVFWEGGFYTSLAEVIKDISTFKTGILKANLRSVNEFARWERDPITQKWKAIKENNIKLMFDRVSPFDWYPAPRASNIKDCFTVEKVPYSRRSLADMIDNPTYNTDAIKELLEQFSKSGVTEATYIDDQRLQVEGKLNGTMGPQVQNVETFDGLEFYGSVQGSMLLELSVKGVTEADKLKEFDIWAIKIGDKIIKVEVNNDIFQQKPYFYTSYEKRIGNVWGFGIPEKMEPLPSACNAAIRAVLVNMSVASGPQMMVNMAALASNETITTIFPRKIWQYRDPTGALGKPIDFFAPPMYSAELMGIYEKFKNECDDITGIPRYAYGNQDVGGAAATARGLSMLMGAATKTIKKSIKCIDDDIITKATDFVFNYLMLASDKEDIKGDLRPCSRGSLTIAAKEELNAARQNFLALTANEFDMPIIGMQGRAALLREIVKGLDMDESEIIPSKEKLDLQSEIEQLKAKMAEQAQAMAQNAQMAGLQNGMNAGGPPPSPASSPGALGPSSPNDGPPEGVPVQ